MKRFDAFKEVNKIPIWIAIIFFIAGYLNSVVPPLIENKNYISNAANSIDEELKYIKFDGNGISCDLNKKNKYINISDTGMFLLLKSTKYKISAGSTKSKSVFTKYIRNVVSTYYILNIVSIFIKYLIASIFIGTIMIAAVELILRKRNTITKSLKPLSFSFGVSSIIVFFIWRIFNFSTNILNIFNLLITSSLFSLIMFNFFNHSMEEYYLGEEEK